MDSASEKGMSSTSQVKSLENTPRKNGSVARYIVQP